MTDALARMWFPSLMTKHTRNSRSRLTMQFETRVSDRMDSIGSMTTGCPRTQLAHVSWPDCSILRLVVSP